MWTRRLSGTAASSLLWRPLLLLLLTLLLLLLLLALLLLLLALLLLLLTQLLLLLTSLCGVRGTTWQGGQGLSLGAR